MREFCSTCKVEQNFSFSDASAAWICDGCSTVSQFALEAQEANMVYNAASTRKKRRRRAHVDLDGEVLFAEKGQRDPKRFSTVLPHFQVLFRQQLRYVTSKQRISTSVVEVARPLWLAFVKRVLDINEEDDLAYDIMRSDNPGFLLAILYLSCLWSRDPVLLCELVHWVTEGELPYSMSDTSMLPTVIGLQGTIAKVARLLELLTTSVDLRSVTIRMHTFLSLSEAVRANALLLLEKQPCAAGLGSARLDARSVELACAAYLFVCASSAELEATVAQLHLSSLVHSHAVIGAAGARLASRDEQLTWLNNIHGTTMPAFTQCARWFPSPPVPSHRVQLKLEVPHVRQGSVSRELLLQLWAGLTGLDVAQLRNAVKKLCGALD
eukprot:TRINITY_DN10219_c0_g1_i1.p1 TRINITY_DN10219_c0_g1~~TRINITY_DN10219_c0_g1_i1.p1  ORF type:complete len:381 (-),score=52.54 TRINITY_DN10219_c0_g1_i1:138-1280(-)